MSATSAPMRVVAREQPEVRVQARGLRVVVAGADVHVVAHAVALAADDEDALGVRLERRQAVDDVHAGLLQRARPRDVRALVEARLELHQADRLLAALGGADQRRDERRVVARAVHGLLDREHVGVVDGLLDEALDRASRTSRTGGAARMSPLAHRRQHVGLLGLVARCSARLGDRRPRRVAQLARSRGSSTMLPQVVEVEQAVDRRTRPRARPRARASSCSRIARLMPAPTSTRTTSPKRRRRSSSSTACSRSSASSETVKSASRVTRKTACRRSPCPGTARRGARRSAPRAARTCARRRAARSAAASPSAPSRARTSARRLTGSRTTTPSDSERLEMYGNGRPSPTASGVSTGKIWRRKRSSRRSRSSASTSSRPTMRMPCSASAGRRSSSRHARLALHVLARPARGSRRASRSACGRPAAASRCRRRPGRAGRRRAP